MTEAFVPNTVLQSHTWGVALHHQQHCQRVTFAAGGHSAPAQTSLAPREAIRCIAIPHTALPSVACMGLMRWYPFRILQIGVKRYLKQRPRRGHSPLTPDKRSAIWGGVRRHTACRGAGRTCPGALNLLTAEWGSYS